MAKLLPEAAVAKRYGVHVCTLGRWDRNPDLGFPPIIQIRGRNYRDADELDAFDEEQRAKPVKRKPFPRSDAFGGEVARDQGKAYGIEALDEMARAVLALAALIAREKREAQKKADRYIARDGGAPSPETKTKLDELGEMGPTEYGRRRDALAEDLGIGKAFLDIEWKARRRGAAPTSEDDDALPPDPEPWPDPVVGAKLLDEIVASARSHLILRPGALRDLRSLGVGGARP